MLKNLHPAENSYWREAYKQSIYSELRNDLSVDVVIVGAGITGLTSAYLLKQSGLKVAVLDKDTIGGGTTGRTTGKVTSQHNLIYADLQKRLGVEKARIYGEANQAAVEQVGRIVKREKIDCEWEQENNYVYTCDPSKVRRLRQEATIAAELGLPATFETSSPLPFEVQAAVKFSGQGRIHAQKYLLGLANAINGSGSYVFENSKVTGIWGGNPAQIRTKTAVISAKHIIVATNVPTFPLIARGAYCALEYPVESYIIAGRIDKTLHGMYISPDKQQYSILPVTTDNGQLLLIGGESHISGLRINKEARYQRLADYAEKRFGINTIEYRWSDRDYLAYDNMPLIGKLYPWSHNLYVATAFMKWGLSNGTVAGMILNDLINGWQNKWASTFDSNRLSPITSIPQVIARYARHPFRP